MKQAVILAGGKGTRLKARLGDLPKPLIDVCGIPLLERQIQLLIRYGFNEIIILVNYASEKIIDFCNLNNNWGINIICIDDGEPLGTAGATLRIFDKLAPEFLVVYGDTMLEVDIDLFYKYHIKEPTCVATLFLHPNDHPSDSDLVEIDDNGKIIEFYPYPHDPSKYYPNLVNAALYWIKKEGIAVWKDNIGMLDFAKNLFPLMLENKLFLKGYNSIEYIKDCGTPERLDKVCKNFNDGKIAKSSINYPQKAIFLDRDGTLNIEVDHLNKVEQFELLPYVSNAIKAINKSQYLACIITNQPVVSRGDCSIANLKQIHNKLETLLGKEGAFIDRIYYCPHHPDSGYSGEVASLKFKCNCRKPKIGMITKASEELNIICNSSWLIGDTTTDLQTAKNAGLRSILVETGYAGLDQKYWVIPDYIVPDINKAVNFILEVYPKIFHFCMNLSSSISNTKILAIGGFSRSGKSTFASVLADVLNTKDRKSHIISLDRWLKNETDREEGVFGRYDIDAINNVIDLIHNRSNGVLKLKLPCYHKLTKKQILDVEEIFINKEDIIIFEGTIALQLLQNYIKSENMFFISLNEEKRKNRVIGEYILRNKQLDEAFNIYNQRQKDEVPFIKSLEGTLCIEMGLFYE
jgi:histidinol-phosphate phosphatase family protein